MIWESFRLSNTVVKYQSYFNTQMLQLEIGEEITVKKEKQRQTERKKGRKGVREINDK